MRISSGQRAGESSISTTISQSVRLKKLETISSSEHVVGSPENCAVTMPAISWEAYGQ
jgi:hypothetical protein